MTREQYKEKLIAFNSSDKYRKEIDLLLKFLSPVKNEKILDIGCGTGLLVNELRKKHFVQAFGYDVNNYRIEDDPHVFRNEFHFGFNKIYFMHSFAHIPDIKYFINNTLDKILMPNGKLFIVTPNRDWIDLKANPEYIADPTVISHYSLSELKNLFVEMGYRVDFQMQFGQMELGVQERILFIASK